MVKKYFKLLVFSYLGLFVLSSYAVEYPYEKCNWTNEDFTNRLVLESQDFSAAQTEAKAVCFDCLRQKFSDFLISVGNKFSENKHQGKIGSTAQISNLMQSAEKANDVPDICFLAAALRGSTKHMAEQHYIGNEFHYCISANATSDRSIMTFSDPPYLSASGDGPNKSWVYPRRPCLNEDYVQMTAKAFNETANCFGFNSKEDKEQLFALMNHESAFLLNKKKKVGNQMPRCYGQVTNNIVADIHVGIKKNNEVYHNIYEDVLKRCPNLRNKIVSLSKCQNYTTIGGFKKCFKKRENADTIKCKTSQDAYSCLFYTMFNIKKNKIDLEEKLSRIFPVSLQIISSKKMQKIAEDFKYPIKLNELVTAKGTIIKNGKRKEIEYVFMNMEEISDAFNKLNIKYRLKDLEIKKVKLFNEKQLKWIFLHLANQKDASIISNNFIHFVHLAKVDISHDTNMLGSFIRKYRENILSGRSLDFKALSKLFNGYADWRNTNLKLKIKDRQRLVEFVNDMEKNLKSMTLINNINKLDKAKGFNTDKAKEFVQAVKAVCPRKLF